MNSLNFKFIETVSPALAREATLAEEYVRRDPESALVKLRRFCEIAVDIVYGEYNLQPPFLNAGLFDLLDNQSFIDKVPDDVREKFSLLRQSGNSGAHVQRYKISAENACLRLREAWDIGCWLYLASKKGTAAVSVAVTVTLVLVKHERYCDGDVCSRIKTDEPLVRKNFESAYSLT